MPVMAWGRQLAVAMTPGDEAAFLAFLREGRDIAILRTPAPSPEAVRLDALPPPRGHGMEQFFLWNRAFPWDPRPAPTTDGAAWYLPGLGKAPVLEYVRDPLRRDARDRGRVYWARTPEADGAFEAGGIRYAYDVAEFERWYGTVVRWLRKTSTPLQGTKPPLHCLPEAARTYGLR